MTELVTRLHNPEFWRFIIAGVGNTVLAYAIYAVLVTVTPYQVAYGGSYLAGIGISYLLNARFVFREAYSLKTFFRYPVVYLVQYLLGSSLLYVSVDMLTLDKYTAPFLVIAITTPLTFMLSRFIIRGNTISTR